MTTTNFLMIFSEKIKFWEQIWNQRQKSAKPSARIFWSSCSRKKFVFLKIQLWFSGSDLLEGGLEMSSLCIISGLKLCLVLASKCCRPAALGFEVLLKSAEKSPILLLGFIGSFLADFGDFQKYSWPALPPLWSEHSFLVEINDFTDDKLPVKIFFRKSIYYPPPL